MPTLTERRSLYGLSFPLEMDDAQVECHMIRKGGQWTEQGRTFGHGNFFHYKRLFRLYWPNEDQHRWEDDALRAIIANQFTTLLGCTGSCKTSTAAKFALCFYSVWPRGTTILISSTDMRGLEMRVFGRLKELIEGAQSRYDWFPGHVIDSKKAIATDDIDEGEIRNLKNGISCFPTGTLVDTPSGMKPIELLQPGEWIINANGFGRIKSTQSSIRPHLIRVHLSNKHHFDCTPEHPVFTRRGWTKAVDLKPFDKVLSAHETMRLLRSETWPQLSQSKVLFQELPVFSDAKSLRSMRWHFSTIENEQQSGFRQILQHHLRWPMGRNSQRMRSDQNRYLQKLWKEDAEGAFQSSVLLSELCAKSEACKVSRVWENVYVHSALENEVEDKILRTILQMEMYQSNVGRQSFAHHRAGTFDPERISGSNSPSQDLHRQDIWSKHKTFLRSGRSFSEAETGGGAGRWSSPDCSQATEGLETNCRVEKTWVVNVEVLEPNDDKRFLQSEGGYRVYNLEVAGHPSYSVNGVIVHNCIPCINSSGTFVGLGKLIGIHSPRMLLIADELQLMSSSYLEAVPNLLNNPVSKFIFIGNPLAQNDPLDRVSEPKDGWSSIGVPQKTTSWPTKYMNGLCLNLPGLDSPNYDYPADKPDRYGYMVGRQKEKMVRESYGEGSQQYCSQILGVRLEGLTARKIITREICEKFDAFRLPIWDGSGTTKVYAVDAAYGSIGGDLCVGGHLEFGKELGGKTVICIGQQKIIPISATGGPPDDQIALFVRYECEALDIDPEHVFFDGRTMLMAAFARLWSGLCKPVDFGAMPTARPVSLDMKIVDEQTGVERLKRCNEHYSKFISELWFALRYAIESGQVCGMTEEILSDAIPREWKTVRGNKVEAESKHEMRKRTGKSPDRTDQVVTGIEGCRRLGFQISKLANPKTNPKRGKDYLDKFVTDYEEMMRGKELATNR